MVVWSWDAWYNELYSGQIKGNTVHQHSAPTHPTDDVIIAVKINQLAWADGQLLMVNSLSAEKLREWLV